MKPRLSPESGSIHSKWLGRVAILSALTASSACSVTQPKSEHPHQGQSDIKRSRELPEIEAEHQDTVEMVHETVKLNGQISPEEVARMHAARDDIFETYINPGFMHHMQQTGRTPEVYDALNLVIRSRHGFEYKEGPLGRIEIVKRRPYTEANENVPDDFSLVVETRGGYLTNLNGRDMTDETSIPPWMSAEEYNRRMPDYRERFWNEYSQHKDVKAYRHAKRTMPRGPARNRRLIELLVEPYEKVSPEMQVTFKFENVDFPQHLVDLMEARNLDFEMQDPRFADLRHHVALQGRTYEDITKYRYPPHNRLQLLVTADPELEGVYQLHTRGNTDQEPLRVNLKGYMLNQQSDGTWEADPRYLVIR